MTLTHAMKEAYADPEVDDDIYETLELDHPSFQSPVRLVLNNEVDMTLPLGEGLGQDLFKACAASLTLQGYEEDGPSSGQLQVDNISGLLVPYLQAAVQAGHQMNVVYRAYTKANLGQPGDIKRGMVITRASLGATSATATLEPETKADRKAFPGMTYSMADYPTLHGAG